MPTISFKKKLSAFKVPKGANMREALTQNGIPVASSCGGEGACTKCVVFVERGWEALPPRNEVEADMAEIQELSRQERLSCQTTILEDVMVDTDYW